MSFQRSVSFEQEINEQPSEETDVLHFGQLLRSQELVQSCSNQTEQYDPYDSGRKPFMCETCYQCFALKAELTVHQETSHSGYAIFFCKQCNKVFNYNCILEQHIHGQSDQFKSGALEIVEPSTSQQDEQSCSNQVATCETTQSDDSTKNNHSKQADNFQCDVCKEYFNSMSCLTRHTNTLHSGKKPYACDLCKENFACKEGLMEHKKRLHSAQKPFVCNTCKKCFAYKQSLQNHMNTHLDISELPFKCDQCLKTFTTKYNLRRHLLEIHSKSNGFKCDICNKEFLGKYYRNKHIETRHLAKCQREFEDEIVVTAFMVTYMARYKCKECSEDFPMKNDLEEHWFTSHAARI